MRCESCSKFVSQEFTDPDSGTGPDLSVTGRVADVSGSVTITAQCAECSMDLKTADIDYEANDIPLDHPKAFGENDELQMGHEFEVELEDLEHDEYRKGGGRRAPTYYGFKGVIRITCVCGWSTDEDVSGYVPASGMDEA